MHTKLKTRLMIIWLILASVILCAFSITLIFANTSRGYIDIGITFGTTTNNLAFELSADGTCYSVSAASNDISGKIYIPKTYTVDNVTLPVTTIAASGFKNKTKITDIIFQGDNLTTIGSLAFSGCSGLTSITIPASVTNVGSNAFINCESLKILVDEENGNFKFLDEYNCLIDSANKILITGFSNSTIPTDGSVTSIGSYAFSSCKGLSSITIPDCITDIGSYAFSSCSNLTRISIPSEVTAIDTGTFEACTNLKDVFLSRRVTVICSYAFNHCSSLSYISLTSVCCIGQYAFCDCTSLTSVNLTTWLNGDGLASGAFDGSGLTSITIPNTLKSIDAFTFSDCSSLRSVTIGSGVTSISGRAFLNSTGLTSIEVNSANTTYHSSVNCLIETSRNKLILGCKNSVIPSGITDIDNEAFYNCSGLTSITIPNSVTSIYSEAFYGCSGLTSITIPSSVTWISWQAFKGTNLTNAYFDDTTGWNEDVSDPATAATILKAGTTLTKK